MSAEVLALFRELTAVPTAPFFEAAVLDRLLAWARLSLSSGVKARRHRGGLLFEYRGWDGPSLVLAAHCDHPGFHLSRVARDGARAKLQGGLPRELLPGARVEAFPARPKDNRPAAIGVLGGESGGTYPVRWLEPPRRGPRPQFAVLSLTPYAIEGSRLLSRSIDDLLGCAVSLEALRRLAAARVKAGVKVAVNRAEEVGFIGALEGIARGVIPAGDSVLSIETSRELPEARSGKGPVIRLGDKTCLFDPNLTALLDAAAADLLDKGRPVQRARLTGGSCEATAYQAFGYETGGLAIPLMNYHNGGPGKVAPEMVEVADIEPMVEFLVAAAGRFAKADSRGCLRSRLDARRRQLSPLLRRA